MALGFLGVFIAGSMTLAHFMHKVLPCGASSGCEKVAADPSSFFLGIPVSVFGLLGYLVLTTLSVLRSYGIASRLFSIVGLLASLIGLVVSIGLTIYSVRVIGALCPWCLASAATMAVIFVCHVALVRRKVESLAKGPRTSWSPIAFTLLVLVGFGVSGGVLSRPNPITMDLAVLQQLPESALVGPGDHILGPRDAPITLIEFADLSCEACREMHSKLQTLVEKERSVRLVFHHLPLMFIPGHQLSRQLAVISEGSKSDAEFWAFISNIYSSSKDHPLEVDAIRDKALLAKATAKVDQDVALARKLKIDETPTYIILTKDGARIPARVYEVFLKLQEPAVSQYLQHK